MAFEDYFRSLEISGDMRIGGDFTVLGSFTFGDAATDNLTVTGAFSQTYSGTNDGHLVTGSGNLTSGKDLVRFSTTGSISSTSNVVAIEQTTGASSAGAYGLYINCTGTNVEALKVDAGTATFDEAVTVSGALNIDGGAVIGAVATGLLISGTTTTAISVTGSATTGMSFAGTYTNCIDLTSATLTQSVDNALFSIGSISAAKSVTVTASYIPLQVYIDSIANPGSEVSLIGGYFKVSNSTADQANLQLVGVAPRVTMGKNVTDAYATQSHLTISANANSAGNMTAVSGKTILGWAPTTGIVSAGLFTIEGAYHPTTGYGVWVDITSGATVTAMLELNCNASTAENGIKIDNSGTLTTGINIAGTSTTGISIGNSATAINISGTATGATGKAFKAYYTVNNANYGDAYALVEADLTLTGTVAGMVGGLSSWVNMAAVTTGSNYVCAQQNGLWSDTGGVLTNGVFIFGMRAQCLLQTNGGVGGATFYPFCIINNTNITTAIFKCNDGSSDLGTTAVSKTTEGKYVPLYTDNAGTHYVLIYN